MKTAFITGGSSGIGKAAALALSQKGFRVILHGKQGDKAEQAAKEISALSGNNAIEFIAADISTVKGMKELSEAVKRKTDILHALVLSSGVILPERVVTEDGMEKTFAVQYLSRFALTQHLLPLLQKGKAKIVHVGAPVIKGSKIYFDNLALDGNFTMMKAMGQAMLANHLFVQEFANHYPASELTMNIMYPGVAKTNIMRETNFLLRTAVALVGKSPEKAAKNAVYLVTDERIHFSGYFLKKPSNPLIKEKIEQPGLISEKLWNTSMRLIQAY